MLFIEFQRRRGLSEFSAMTSAKYFDLAFVIIVLHLMFVTRDVCEICAMFVRDCGEGF